MKTILATIALLAVSLQAQAWDVTKYIPKGTTVNANSSFGEIYTAGLWPAFPSVSFGGTAVSVYNTCQEGNSLKAMVSECQEYKVTGNRIRCAKSVNVMKSVPLTNEVTYSTGENEMGSEGSGKTTVTTPVSYDVEVYSNYGGEMGGRVEFTKTFTVPACQ